MEQELSIYTSGAPDTWHDLIPTGAGTQYLHFRSTWYLAWSNTYWNRNSVFTFPEHLIPGMIWYRLEQELSIYTSGAPDTWHDLIPTGAGTQYLHFRSTWYLAWSDTYWSRNSVYTLPEHLIPGMIWYLLEQELNFYLSGAPDIWNDLIPTGAWAQCWPFLSTWYLEWHDTYWSTSSVFTLPEHLISGMIWHLLEHELSVDPSRAPDIWNDLIPTGAGTATLPVHMNSLLPLLVGLFWLNH